MRDMGSGRCRMPDQVRHDGKRSLWADHNYSCLNISAGFILAVRFPIA
jgi:hypothetical protein